MKYGIFLSQGTVPWSIQFLLLQKVNDISHRTSKRGCVKTALFCIQITGNRDIFIYKHFFLFLSIIQCYALPVFVPQVVGPSRYRVIRTMQYSNHCSYEAIEYEKKCAQIFVMLFAFTLLYHDLTRNLSFHPPFVLFALFLFLMRPFNVWFHVARSSCIDVTYKKSRVWL